MKQQKFSSNLPLTQNVSRDDKKRKYSPQQSHDHDMINIQILKTFNSSLYKSLKFIFKSFFEKENFPAELNKFNLLSVLYKTNKRSVKYFDLNYLPQSCY